MKKHDELLADREEQSAVENSHYEAGKVSETLRSWQMMHWLVALLLAEQWHVVWWLLLLFPDVL